MVIYVGDSIPDDVRNTLCIVTTDCDSLYQSVQLAFCSWNTIFYDSDGSTVSHKTWKLE